MVKKKKIEKIVLPIVNLPFPELKAEEIIATNDGEELIKSALVKIKEVFEDKEKDEEKQKEKDKKFQELQKFVLEFGQFPFKERKTNYQDYWLEGYGYIPGSRNVRHRYEEMVLPDYGEMSGSVLDLGCQIGSMLTEAYMRGASPCVGLDFQPEFIECAKKIAAFNKYDINYYEADLTKVDVTTNFIKSLMPPGFVWDVVFALSIFKHIEPQFADLLRNINFKTLYIEGHNAANKGFESDMNKRIEKFLNSTGWGWERLGMTMCRSPRCLWIVRR